MRYCRFAPRNGGTRSDPFSIFHSRIRCGGTVTDSKHNRLCRDTRAWSNRRLVSGFGEVSTST